MFSTLQPINQLNELDKINYIRNLQSHRQNLLLSSNDEGHPSSGISLNSDKTIVDYDVWPSAKRVDTNSNGCFDSYQTTSDQSRKDLETYRDITSHIPSNTCHNDSLDLKQQIPIQSPTVPRTEHQNREQSFYALPRKMVFSSENSANPSLLQGIVNQITSTPPTKVQLKKQEKLNQLQSYQCPYPTCGKKFEHRLTLISHEKHHHSGIKNFSCLYPNCNQSYFYSRDLTKHEKSHRLYCTKCHLKLSNALDLQNHILAHQSKQTNR
ncbi:hypothetical protein BC833DRAFT_567538 [Globomyces pollinis-pini]|nr:hypothetical protein BC833DRAFT_567538 [Globomyces pollinis-pini]